MKKPITNFVLGVLLLVAAVASAQQPIFFLAPLQIEKNVGTAFTVDVNVSNFQKIGSMQFGIRYRAFVLKLDSIHFPNPLALLKLNGSSVIKSVNGSTGQGVVSTAWFDESFNGPSLPNNTTLFTLHFKGLMECRDTLKFGNIFTGDSIEIGQVNIQGDFVSVGMVPIKSTVKIGGGTDCFVATRETDSLQPTDFDIFPNPFSDRITVRPTTTFSSLKNCRISLTDCTGRLLFEKNGADLTSDGMEIANLISYFKGIYFLTIQTERATFSTKLVKLADFE